MNKFDEWAKKIEDLKNVGDKLGMGIDKKIIEVVAVLNLMDIKTTQSCEGHLDRALPYPWVQIGSVQSEQLNEKRQKMFEIRKELDEKVQQKFSEKDFAEIRHLENEINDLIGIALSKPIELLTSFYKTKGGAGGDERLIIVDFADGGRIQPQGGCLQMTRSIEKRTKKLEIYQGEVSRFKDFLKELFLSA